MGDASQLTEQNECDGNGHEAGSSSSGCPRGSSKASVDGCGCSVYLLAVLLSLALVFVTQLVQDDCQQ